MSRTRSSNNIEPQQTLVGYSVNLSAVGTCTTPPKFSAPTTTLTYQVPASTQRSMTDEVTPQFEKLRNKGFIVNNPMTKSLTSVVLNPVKYAYYAVKEFYGCTPQKWYPGTAYNLYGEKSIQSCFNGSTLPWPAPPTFSDSEIATNEGIAITQAFSNINTSDILALATLAESGKSIAGLTGLMRSAFGIHKKTSLKIGKVYTDKKRSASLADVADLYMEARYNLRPLYYDIRGVLKALSNHDTSKHRQTFRSSRTIVKDASTQIAGKSFYNDPGMVLVEKANVVSKLENVARAGVLTDVDQLDWFQVWGVDRIVNTVWELTPYSFIIDWFINVGDTISSWTPNYGVKTLASWVTSTTTLTQSLIVGNPTVNLYPTGSYRWTGVSMSSSGQATRLVVTQKRTPNYARPVLPNVSVKLDPLKLLDLAIITGLFKKTKPRNHFRI